MFLETHVYDPETGRLLELHDEQRVVVEAFNTRDDNGNFIYSDWVYSAIKKSGKTTIAAGLVLWQAWRVANGQAYVIANDLKQADSRMFRVIEYAVKKHPDMKHFARVVRYKIILDNGTFIEALPVDPQGEAGMNPTVIAYTEAWGAKGNKAEMMWTEAVLSPTRAGQAFRLVESYAGHTGESLILERLYDSVVKPELCIDPEHEIYANPSTGTVAYWCTRRVMPWQNDDAAQRYYANEAATKEPNEYRRQHHNEWVTSTDVFVQPEWWQACKVDAVPSGRQIVLALDAAVSGDTFSIVGVSREGDIVHVQIVRIFTPPKAGKIDFGEVKQTVRDIINSNHVVCLVYDPMQLEDMMQKFTREGLVWCEPFKQQTPRLIADNALRNRIRDRKLVHTGDDGLTEHVLNANMKTDDEDHRLRIIKRSENKKIDAAVALSMASHQASELNIG